MLKPEEHLKVQSSDRMQSGCGCWRVNCDCPPSQAEITTYTSRLVRTTLVTRLYTLIHLR